MQTEERAVVGKDVVLSEIIVRARTATIEIDVRANADVHSGKRHAFEQVLAPPEVHADARSSDR